MREKIRDFIFALCLSENLDGLTESQKYKIVKYLYEMKFDIDSISNDEFACILDELEEILEE